MDSFNTQEQRLDYLVAAFQKDSGTYRDFPTPRDTLGKRRLLRSLMNIRMPRPMPDEVITVQDAYLKEVIARKGITRLETLDPISGDLYLWQGDITTLACDAIVNAANSGMLGCFQPLHNCIDNCIHTYAGIQLRLRCAEL